jgi:hypothetical protein
LLDANRLEIDNTDAQLAVEGATSDTLALQRLCASKLLGVRTGILGLRAGKLLGLRTGIQGLHAGKLLGLRTGILGLSAGILLLEADSLLRRTVPGGLQNLLLKLRLLFNGRELSSASLTLGGQRLLLIWVCIQLLGLLSRSRKCLGLSGGKRSGHD